jgi:hypothetical protein
MAQMIYAIAALAAVTLFSVSLRHSGVNTEQEMFITEARTRMIGIARESVEEISRMELPFDEKTDADRLSQYVVFPYVSSAAELTAVGAFGGCTTMHTGCLDLDDFHGLELLDQDADGLPFDLAVEVVYVDTLSGAASGSQTYAKELTVTVTTGAVRISEQPVSVSYSRVYAYPSIFEYARGAESRLNGEIYQ